MASNLSSSVLHWLYLLDALQVGDKRCYIVQDAKVSTGCLASHSCCLFNPLIYLACGESDLLQLTTCRDDDYICMMLRCLRYFHMERVLTNMPPESSFYQQLAGYDDFLAKTVQLAASVQGVPHQPTSLAAGSDANAFWRGS